MRNLIFWLLFPFVAPQALYLRRSAPRFAPAAGPASGTIGDGELVRLLAIGDSIVAGVGARSLANALVGRTAAALAEAKNCQVHWIAAGVSGYDSSKVLHRLVPEIPTTPFDHIIVSVGVNDITGLKTLRHWRRNLRQLLQILHRHSPNATIAVAGIPPMHRFPLLPQPLRAVIGLRAREFDRIARIVVAGQSKAHYVALEFEPDPDEFSGDGYHPSEASYAGFGEAVAEHL